MQGIRAGELHVSCQQGGAVGAQPDEQAFGVVAEGMVGGEVVVPGVGFGHLIGWERGGEGADGAAVRTVAPSAGPRSQAGVRAADWLAGADVQGLDGGKGSGR